MPLTVTLDSDNPPGTRTLGLSRLGNEPWRHWRAAARNATIAMLS